MGGKLPRSFYARPTAEVACDLLGMVLVRRLGDSILSGRIVEDEAYGGTDDPGSHAFRGSTARNHSMFGPPGHLYIYRIYAVHICMNVVCETANVAGAVLVRALHPLQGIQQMERYRGVRSERDLCNGPAKLCQALDITLRDDGVDLEGDEIWIEDDGTRPAEVAVSTRIGLSRGREAPLRFYVPGNPYVSRGKPSGG